MKPQHGEQRSQLTDLGKGRRKWQTLETELVIANTHLHFFRELWNARGDFAREFNQAKDFWDYTKRAHVGMALLQLCRVFDKDLAGINFVRLLAELEKRHSFSQEELQQFEQDQRDCGHPPQHKLVIKLREWRNNIIAHYNHDHALEEQQAFRQANRWHDLTELQTLIDFGFEILDRYAPLHDCRPARKRLVDGANGHRVVLNALRYKHANTK